MTPRLPRQPLFRLLLVNGLAGAVGAIVVVAGLILADVGALGTIVLSAREPIVPILLMTAGFTITLASAAMGVAVMRLGSKTGSDPDGGRPARPARPARLAAVRHPAVR